MPRGIALDSRGRIVVADFAGRVLRLSEARDSWTVLASRLVPPLAAASSTAQSEDPRTCGAEMRQSLSLPAPRECMLSSFPVCVRRRGDRPTACLRQQGNGLHGTEQRLPALKAPAGVAVDGDGVIYVADARAHAIFAIREHGASGNTSLHLIAGDDVAGHVDGLGVLLLPVHAFLRSILRCLRRARRLVRGAYASAIKGPHVREARVQPAAVCAVACVRAAYAHSARVAAGYMARFVEPYSLALTSDGRHLVVADRRACAIRLISLPPRQPLAHQPPTNVSSGEHTSKAATTPPHQRPHASGAEHSVQPDANSTPPPAASEGPVLMPSDFRGTRNSGAVNASAGVNASVPSVPSVPGVARGPWPAVAPRTGKMAAVAGRKGGSAPAPGVTDVAGDASVKQALAKIFAAKERFRNASQVRCPCCMLCACCCRACARVSCRQCRGRREGRLRQGLGLPLS